METTFAVRTEKVWLVYTVDTDGTKAIHGPYSDRDRRHAKYKAEELVQKMLDQERLILVKLVRVNWDKYH